MLAPFVSKSGARRAYLAILFAKNMAHWVGANGHFCLVAFFILCHLTVQCRDISYWYTFWKWIWFGANWHVRECAKSL